MTLVQWAEKYLGVSEKGGPNRGVEVERFQKTVDGKAEGEAWCMCFVQTVLKEWGLSQGKVPAIYQSEHCMTVFNKSDKKLRLEKPEVGCVVIFQHYRQIAGEWKPSASGHTGIVKRVLKDSIVVIEGNTNSLGSREGDAVCEKTRRLSSQGSLRIKGFLRPFV